MKHSVLLLINLALDFYKNSIYIVYRAIHQLFVFPYKHYTSPKNGSTTTSEKSTKKKNTKHQINTRRGTHPTHGLFFNIKFKFNDQKIQGESIVEVT